MFNLKFSKLKNFHRTLKADENHKQYADPKIIEPYYYGMSQTKAQNIIY